MNTNHTPGMWRIGEHRTGEPSPWDDSIADYERAIFSQDGVKIAVMEQWHPHCDQEAEANARLIAAAPAMLDALLEIAETCERGFPRGYTTPVMLYELRLRAEAAIAAATGEKIEA